MYRKAVDDLVSAVESGLMANPELMTQTDPCKRGIWRDVLGPALREAKAASSLALSAEQVTLLYHSFNFVAGIHNDLSKAQMAGANVIVTIDQADLFERVGALGTDLLNTLRNMATKSSIHELT
jgi:hypothetical protein